MSQSIKCGINIVAAYSLVEEMSELTDYLNKTFGLTFSEGVGDNQINLVFHDERPLAKGATENPVIEFHAGELTNKVGQSITMDRFKFLLVKNNSTDSTLIVGGDANNLAIFAEAADKEVIQPLGVKLFLAPVDGINCETDAKLKMEHGDEGTSAPKYSLIAAGVDLA